MLAVVIGYFSICLGFLILFLPVLITELSRPRDSAWGALLMVLGLILVSSNERFQGSPMLAVLLNSLLVGRLLSEVFQYRWTQLSQEEKDNLSTFKRWRNSFQHSMAASSKLMSIFLDLFKLFRPKPKPSAIGKKWVRPDTDDEKKSLDAQQLSSSKGKIEEKTNLPDPILKTTSSNTPSDVS